MVKQCGVNPKITVRIAIFLSSKQRAFPLNRDKITYRNLDSAKTPVSPDKSISLLVSPKDGLDAIHSNADEFNSNEFISVNSTDSEYNSKENPIFFSQKHLNDLIIDLCLKKNQSSLHQG